MLILTARYHSRDPDRLDITRMGCDRDRKSGKPTPGEFLAPSWEILKPALAWRRSFETECEANGKDASAAYFEVYRARYRAEMVTSYRTRRAEWTALLARPRVVLVCFCPEPTHCHRTIAAGFLVACGAEHGGEIATPSKRIRSAA